MMGIRHLIAAQFLRLLVEGSFPHLCAEGTGIALFPLIKDDLRDVCLHHRERQPQGITQFFYFLHMEPGMPQVHSDHFYGKGMGVEAHQPVECIEHGQAVFSS